MSQFLSGVRFGLGAAFVWACISFTLFEIRQWRKETARLTVLAHPEQPVCLARHDHKGRQLADYMRVHCGGATDAELAAACDAFRTITRVAGRRHGGHAAEVLACDLDGAIRDLTAGVNVPGD